MMVRVELKGFIRQFADGTRIGPIDLCVEDGELLTLLGPSGSGKTTTLRMISGLIRADSGSLLFDGEDVAHVPPRERGIGMVFQSIALFPNMTVYQNIAFGPEMAGWSYETTVQRVEELADLVGIKGLLFRRTSEISGGEGQRVALARALALKPKLLLLDEPLSALDPQLREHLQIEIREIQRNLGITTIYVTHSQDEAFAMSDKIAVLNEGCVVQVERPQDLYDNPKSEFVASFVGGGNIFRGVVVEDSVDNLVVLVENHRFAVAGAGTVGQHITFTVKPEDILIETEKPIKGAKAMVVSVTPQIGTHRIILDFDGSSISAYVADDSLAERIIQSSQVGFSFKKNSVVILSER